MAKRQTSIKERQRADLREPRRYKVILHNDDFTPFEFVEKMLSAVFFLSTDDARKLADTVHREGKGVVGIYTYDIAVTKVYRAKRMIEDNGYPLRITIEHE